MRWAVLAFLWPAAMALAADYHVDPSNYRAALTRLEAGDRLVLQAGDYARGLPLHGLRGEQARPIVIEGPAAGARARFLARPGANTLSLVDVSHIVVRHLELDGRNLPVDAVKAEGHARFAHFVTLENLHIHDHAANQQNVGISSKCPAFGWVIRGNSIERVGTGTYLGNSDGHAPFVAGLIEGNRITATLGYNLQIKHQRPRPDNLPEAGRRWDTVIRHNSFSKESGGSGETLARPNVLLGHFPLSGPGATDRYLVHGNLFWQNPTESLFQGEGNLALYNNVFINHHGPAVRIQPHNDVPRQVDVLRNTVLARDEGIAIRLREGQADAPRRIRNNLVFAHPALTGGEASDNLVGRLEDARLYLVRPEGPGMSINLTPRAAALADAQVLAYSPDYPDLDLDFFGRKAALPRIGALGPTPAPDLREWPGAR